MIKEIFEHLADISRTALVGHLTTSPLWLSTAGEADVGVTHQRQLGHYLYGAGVYKRHCKCSSTSKVQDLWSKYSNWVISCCDLIDTRRLCMIKEIFEHLADISRTALVGHLTTSPLWLSTAGEADVGVTHQRQLGHYLYGAGVYKRHCKCSSTSKVQDLWSKYSNWVISCCDLIDTRRLCMIKEIFEHLADISRTALVGHLTTSPLTVHGWRGRRRSHTPGVYKRHCKCSSTSKVQDL